MYNLFTYMMATVLLIGGNSDLETERKKDRMGEEVEMMIIILFIYLFFVDGNDDF